MGYKIIRDKHTNKYTLGRTP